MRDDGRVTQESSDADVALAAAEAGAAVVRATYGGNLTRHPKAERDFATDADLDAERASWTSSPRRDPTTASWARRQANAGEPGPGAGLSTRCAGPSNFAAQTPLVAVNVAFVDDSDSLACTAADPFSGETFWAGTQGAFVRRHAVDEPIRPSAESRRVDVNCDGPTDRPFVGPQLIADARFRAEFGPRVISTTLAVAWVAAGRHAAYVSDGTFVDNVHFAAGIGLCIRAGCVVTDLAGNPLNSGRGLIVAADPEVHERFVDIIQPHLASVTGSARSSQPEGYGRRL